MTRYLGNFPVLLIALFLVFPHPQACAEQIILWGNFQKAPKIFLQNEEPHGILVEIGDLIAQELQTRFDYKLSSWARAYVQAKAPAMTNEGIIGIKKNPERLKVFDFSEPIYNDTNYLVVLKSSNLRINNIEDLTGLRVSYNRNGYFGPEFERAKGIFIDEADTHNTIRLRRLLKGRIDAALLGGPGDVGLRMAVALDQELVQSLNKFELVPLEFSNPDHIAFAKSLKQTELIGKINEVIRKLRASGKIKKIVDKYSRATNLL